MRERCRRRRRGRAANFARQRWLVDSRVGRVGPRSLVLHSLDLKCTDNCILYRCWATPRATAVVALKYSPEQVWYLVLEYMDVDAYVSIHVG